LIDSGSDLLVEDRRGYNILHILAFNNNVEIYRFMHENWKEKCAILEKTVSKSGMTPLQYSAYLEKREILEEILSQRRILLWKYVKTASYAYPLEEIDSMVSFAEPKLPAPKEAPKRVESSEEVLNNVSAGDSGDDKKEHKHHKKHHFSVLEMIVYTSNHSVEDKLERAHMLEIPFIHQLLFDKWNGYAGLYPFSFSFVINLIIIIIITRDLFPPLDVCTHDVFGSVDHFHHLGN
jgi:hypothetical protein